jgi:hypothetical protein
MVTKSPARHNGARNQKAGPDLGNPIGETKSKPFRNDTSHMLLDSAAVACPMAQQAPILVRLGPDLPLVNVVGRHDVSLPEFLMLEYPHCASSVICSNATICPMSVSRAASHPPVGVISGRALRWVRNRRNNARIGLHGGDEAIRIRSPVLRLSDDLQLSF